MNELYLCRFVAMFVRFNKINVKEQGDTLSNKDGMEHIIKQVSCMYMHVCVYIDYAHMHDSLGNRTSM